MILKRQYKYKENIRILLLDISNQCKDSNATSEFPTM